MDDPGPVYRAARSRLVGTLDMVRADIKWLRTELKTLATATAIPEVEQFQEIGRRFNDLVSHMPQLDEPLAASSELFENAAQRVEELKRCVALARESADPIDGPLKPGDVPTMQGAATSTGKPLADANEAIERLVLGYRLRQQLHGLRVGKCIDFAKDYAEELPTVEERTAALTQFSRDHGYFDEAVFDVAGQVVWRRSASAGWRIASLVVLCVWPLLIGGLLALASLLPLENIHLDDMSDVLAAYGLVLAGALVHLVVENIKQAQAKTAIIAIGDTLDWLHLRWPGLLWSFVPIVVVVVGLLAIGTQLGGEEALVFFFGGYSSDSVAGTFLTRFGTAAGTGVRNVAQLAAGAPQP